MSETTMKVATIRFKRNNQFIRIIVLDYPTLNSIETLIKSKLERYANMGPVNVQSTFSVDVSLILLEKMQISSINDMTREEFESAVKAVVGSITDLNMLLITNNATVEYEFAVYTSLRKLTIQPNRSFNLVIDTVNINPSKLELLKTKLSKVKGIGYGTNYDATVQQAVYDSGKIKMTLVALKPITLFESISYALYENLTSQDRAFYILLFNTLGLRSFALNDQFFESVSASFTDISNLVYGDQFFSGIFVAKGNGSFKKLKEAIEDSSQKLKKKLQESAGEGVKVIDIVPIRQYYDNNEETVEFKVIFKVEKGYVVNLSSDQSTIAVGSIIGTIVVLSLVALIAAFSIVGLNVTFKNWEKVQPVIPEASNMLFYFVVMAIIFFFMFVITRFIGS